MRGNSLSAFQANSLIQSTYLAGSFEIIYSAQAMLQKALELAVQKNITSAKIFDLRLAAAALSAQANYFITYNTKDFSNINGLIPRLPPEVIPR